MEFLRKYYEHLEEGLQESVGDRQPAELYEPVRYILSIGGKRVRPSLTLMTCDFLTGEFQKAIPAALAVEMFHNFSLMHDDIMDEAPLRRGEKSVHEKWNLNTAILSGDAMLILAYRLFEKYEAEKFQQLAKLFSETALQVCEGQQLDMDFEVREDVSIPEYLKMIEQKTAVLLGAAMEMGAIVADASLKERQKLYDFGKNLGIAFQLQDDYLDVFGNPETFGKQVGGDIISNKKTFLYLTALEKGNEEQKKELIHLYSISPAHPEDKIETVRKIFETSQASEIAQKQIEKYSNTAFSVLDDIDLPENKKELFREFGTLLMERTI